ncbi:MAG TPA: 6,7-dimethyl-8-ribityllumazine synthase [Steroidobacteraceae bacterium]|jgi:6,7-dimethyl-8-ribityllumazine synthase|nr:6,7-dimethyl-8-ribityllumazine synthase [Steroidobacteraceae bacterium]
MTGSQQNAQLFDASPWRVAVVAARFNAVLVDQLIDGATRAWGAHGGKADELIVVRVPGAFELPLAALKFAASGEYHAVIALGCVVRGDTPHFDYVAGECARGLMDAGLATGIPVIFGVLTTENQAQAAERASLNRMNKGGESMEAALEMIELLAPFNAPARSARRKKPSASKKGRR